MEEADAGTLRTSVDAAAHAASFKALSLARLDTAASLREDLIDEDASGEAARLVSLLPGLHDAFDKFESAFGVALDALICDAGAAAGAMAAEERSASAAICDVVEAADAELRQDLHALDGVIKRAVAAAAAAARLVPLRRRGSLGGAAAAAASLVSTQERQRQLRIITAESDALASKAVVREVGLHSRIEVGSYRRVKSVTGMRTHLTRLTHSGHRQLSTSLNHTS